MQPQPVFISRYIFRVKTSVCFASDKTDIGLRVYIANIFTFTTLIDRFTSCVC